MGLYHSLLLPPLLDWAMKNDELRRIRERLIPLARGRVLEVGCGSGLNLPYYGDDVKELWAIDPNPALISMACRRAKDLPFSIEFLERTAETIPMHDRSFDTVVTTWTLCSVSDIGSALHEMRRVLKPGGLLLFAEHGTAPDAAVRSWQDRLTPFWKRIAGGCHLNRKPDDELRAAGLRIDRLETRYIHGPRPFTFMYEGRASAPLEDVAPVGLMRRARQRGRDQRLGASLRSSPNARPMA